MVTFCFFQVFGLNKISIHTTAKVVTASRSKVVKNLPISIHTTAKVVTHSVRIP